MTSRPHTNALRKESAIRITKLTNFSRPRTKQRIDSDWGLCPQTPEIYRFVAKMAGCPGAAFAAPATSAPKSALELRLRSALSSAQVPTSLCPKSERMSVGRTPEHINWGIKSALFAPKRHRRVYPHRTRRGQKTCRQSDYCEQSAAPRNVNASNARTP